MRPAEGLTQFPNIAAILILAMILASGFPYDSSLAVLAAPKNFTSVSGRVLYGENDVFTPVKGIMVLLKDTLGKELERTFTDGAGFYSFNISKYKKTPGFVLHIREEAQGFAFSSRADSMFSSDIGRLVDSPGVEFVFGPGAESGPVDADKLAFFNALYEFRQSLFGSESTPGFLLAETFSFPEMVARARNALFAGENHVIYPAGTEGVTIRRETGERGFTLYIPKGKADPVAIKRALARVVIVSLAPFATAALNDAGPEAIDYEMGRRSEEGRWYIIELADFLAIFAGVDVPTRDIDDLIGLSHAGLEKVRDDLQKRIEFYRLYATRMRKAASKENEYELVKMRNLLSSGKVPDPQVFEKTLERISAEFERMNRGLPVLEDYLDRLRVERDRFSTLVVKKKLLMSEASTITGMPLKILKDFYGVVKAPNFLSYALAVLARGRQGDFSSYLRDLLTPRPYDELYKLLPKYGSFRELKVSFVDTFREIDPAINTDFEVDRMVDTKLDIDENGRIRDLENLKEDLAKYIEFARGNPDFVSKGDGFSLERFVHFTEGSDRARMLMTEPPPLPESERKSHETELMAEPSYYSDRLETADLSYMGRVHAQKLKDMEAELDSNMRKVKAGRISFSSYQVVNRKLLRRVDGILAATENSISGEAARWYHKTLRAIRSAPGDQGDRILDLNRVLVGLIKQVQGIRNKYSTFSDLTFRRTMDIGKGVEAVNKELGGAIEKFVMTEDMLFERIADLGQVFSSRYGTREVNDGVARAAEKIKTYREALTKVKGRGEFAPEDIHEVRTIISDVKTEMAPVADLQSIVKFFYDRYQKESVEVKVAAKEAERKLSSMRMTHGNLMNHDEAEVSYLMSGVLVRYDEEKLFERYKTMQNRVLAINRFEISRAMAEASTLESDAEALMVKMDDQIEERNRRLALKRRFLVDILACGRPVTFDTREVRLTRAQLDATEGMVVLTGKIGTDDVPVRKIVITTDGGKVWEEVSGLKYWIHDFFPRPGTVYRVAFKLVATDNTILDTETPAFTVTVED